MAQAKGLGKGLSALMSDVVEPAVKEAADTTLNIDQLVAGKYQPRRQFADDTLHELADSIEKNGIVQPILVRELANGKYEIIAGERRFRAAKLAKLKEVPVVIRRMEDAQALEVALIENIQRQDLNPLEEAQAYERLMKEFNHTQEKLAQSVGKSRSHIANLLRLLGLPEKVKKRIDSGELSMGHARALVNAKDPAALAEQIIAEGLSVRQAEALAKGITLAQVKEEAPEKPRSSKPSSARINEDVAQIEQMLSDNLGLKVSIAQRGKHAGDVTVRYNNLAELDEILRRLGGGV